MACASSSVGPPPRAKGSSTFRFLLGLPFEDCFGTLQSRAIVRDALRVTVRDAMRVDTRGCFTRKRLYVVVRGGGLGEDLRRTHGIFWAVALLLIGGCRLEGFSYLIAGVLQGITLSPKP